MPQLLPRVLILHTGGTLGMDIQESFEAEADAPQLTPLQLKKGTGGTYKGALGSWPSIASAMLLLHLCRRIAPSPGNACAVRIMK
jgi:hypothetical protein